MPVFLFVLMMVLTLCYRELRVGVTAEADLLKGGGGFRACIFGIPLVKMRFDLDLDKKRVIPRPAAPRKGKAVRAAGGGKTSDLLGSALTLAANLRVRCIGADVRVGAADDSFLTTLAFGSARVLVHAVLAFLKSRYPSAAVYAPLTPEFRRDSAQISLSAVAYISIADILYGLVLLAVKRVRARTKNEKRITDTVNNE